MKEQYSLDEILGAMNDLLNTKKANKKDTVVINKSTSKPLDIPSNTLKLIEEAEKAITSKILSK